MSPKIKVKENNVKEIRIKEIHGELLAIARTISPLLLDAIAQNGPLSVPHAPTEPFPERLCRAVTGQQLSVKAAASIWKRLASSPATNTTLMAHFATALPEQLQGCGLSRAKTKTIQGIAEAAKAGQLDTTELSQLTHAARTQKLTALWGVGQWTADMMGIFYFGDADIWPDGDTAARKTLEQLTSKRRKTTRTAAHFTPYRSYLALHMWKHLDASPD
ncbi:MAG: DNA-3-methyladenine glycosylase 2 family protein [Cyanobacteria bacterium J06634_5]